MASKNLGALDNHMQFKFLEYETSLSRKYRIDIIKL